MNQNTYTMLVALINALEVADSIEAFASCRDNVYGDIEKALERLGPQAVALYEVWADCGILPAFDDICKTCGQF